MPANSSYGRFLQRKLSTGYPSRPGGRGTRPFGAFVGTQVAWGLLLTAYLTAPVNGGVSRLTPNPYQSSF